MSTIHLLSIVGLSAALLTASQAHAIAPQTPVCGPRDQMVANLAEKYHEAPIAGGINKDGLLVAIFQAHDEGTWTALLIDPKGTACVLFTGESWQNRFDDKKEPAL